MKRYIALIFAAALMLSCTESRYTPEFLTDDTIRLEIGDKDIFTYSAIDCQYAYNIERAEFRSHTDNMSKYFKIDLEVVPGREGVVVRATRLEWTTEKGMNQVRKNMDLEVVKMEGPTIWLWNSRESIKIALRFE